MKKLKWTRHQDTWASGAGHYVITKEDSCYRICFCSHTVGLRATLSEAKDLANTNKTAIFAAQGGARRSKNVSLTSQEIGLIVLSLGILDNEFSDPAMLRLQRKLLRCIRKMIPVSAGGIA